MEDEVVEGRAFDRLEEVLVLLEAAVVVDEDFAAHFAAPFANSVEEFFGEVWNLGNDPVVTAWVAAFAPGDKDYVEKLSFPEHVEPGVFDVLFEFPAADPFSSNVVED